MINKKKMIICVCIMVLIPILIQRLSITPIFFSTSNDWVGFWGSYIGAIVGAGVALYVLMETLEENKKVQKRTEVIEFCNCIAEKSSLFAQRYEESLYEAHTYLAINELKTSQSEQKFGMYKQFIATHHSAKAMLYEIETYLTIRKDIPMFNTPKFQKTLKVAERTYYKFKGFESEVAKAEKVADVDDKELIKVVEEFLELLNQYEKELLDEIVQEHRNGMKTLKEIYKNTKETITSKQKEDIVTRYMEVLKEEINGNKVRLMIYKEECQNKVDLNLPMFWISVLSTILTVLSITIAMIVWMLQPEEAVSIVWVFGYLVFVLLVETLYYQLVLKEKKKYSLMMLVLESIELEMNENSLSQSVLTDMKE